MEGADFPVVGCGHCIGGLLATGWHFDVDRIRVTSDRGNRCLNRFLAWLPAIGSGQIDHGANGGCKVTGRSIVGVDAHRNHLFLLLRRVIVLSFDMHFHFLVNFVRGLIVGFDKPNVAVVASAER
jgi:hypothetical protein